MQNDNQIQIQIQILKAISQEKSSEDEIANSLNLEGSTVDYYLNLLKNNHCIKDSKGWLGTAGNPRQKYLHTYLTSKGQAALQNPDILKGNQESSGITINQSGNSEATETARGK